MRLPRIRSASGLILAGGLGLTVLLSATFVALFADDRGNAIAEQMEGNELFARVFEEQVTRSIDTAALALAAVADELPEAGPPVVPASALAQTLAAVPQLREIALLDASGLVLASSNAASVGRRIAPTELGVSSRAGNALGPLRRGRSLGAGGAGAAGQIASLPLTRRLERAGGAVYVVALIHAEGFANQMRLTLSEGSRRAILASYEGATIADTAQGEMPETVGAIPVFHTYLPGVEFAAYTGQGVAEGEQTVAFRVSRNWPLVVIVERSHGDIVSEWSNRARWRMLAGLFAVAAVGGLSWSTARSLRARHRERQRVNAMQVEAERQARELAVIAQSVQELLFRTDPGGRLTFVNERWTEAVGALAERVVGDRFEALVLPSERDAVRLLFARSDDEVRTATVTFGAFASARRFDVAVVPLREGEVIAGFAGSAVDITERERTQARLAEELAFSALLQELSPLPTSMIDGTGRYRDVNRAWQEFTGLAREEIVGRPTGTWMNKAEADMHARHDRELMAKGGQVRYECVSTLRDGSRRDLIVSKVVVPARGGATQGLLCTFMDVTEIRDAARLTQQARETAEDASRAKSEFIANISHELRTPLQTILGFSELGVARAKGQEKLAGMFADVLSAGKRMLALVNDLLDVSKIESAVGTMRLERADVRPLLRDVLHEMRTLLADRRLQVDLRLAGHALVAKLDPTRFQQVLRNVVANAIKFAPPGSTLEVEADVGEDGGAHVMVRDHGPGIPPREIESIFEAFVQSSSTKDGSGGTGLGLAICRKIMAAHGGEIAAENAIGGGSRFHIHLPARAGAETRPLELTT